MNQASRFSNITEFFRKHGTISASFIFAIFLIIFLSRGIFSNGYFTSAGTVRDFPPFVAVQSYNKLLTDPAFQFVPWLSESKNILQTGHFPLWNIYAGGGQPLFANMQSAVLYPASFFFYFFNFKVAFLLAAFLKLFFVGLFTYLYLRRLKMQHWVGIAGGTAAMFSGFTVAWLAWPHTNVIFLLPCGLFLLESFFQSALRKYLLYLSIAICIALFGGHPETFFYIMCILSVYALFRSIQIYLTPPEKSPSANSNRLKDFFGAIFKYAGSVFLGLGLGAILLLPFLEYLRLSSAALTRSGTSGLFLFRTLTLLNFSPDLLGNPASGRYITDLTNYNESTMGYVGIALLFLALFALVVYWRRPLVRFYGLLGAVCFAIAYKLPFTGWVFALPIFRSAANHRLTAFFGFSVIILGCYALDKADFKTARKTTVIALTFFIAIMAGLYFIFARNLHFMLHQNIADAAQNAAAHAVIYSAFGITIASLILFVIILFFVPRKFLPALVIIFIFAETGLHGLAYNPVTAKNDFYPANPAISLLSAQFPNGYNKVLFTSSIFPPNLGTWYGINQVATYDALESPSYQNIKKQLGSFTGSPEFFESDPNMAAAKFYGIKYIVTPVPNGSINDLRVSELATFPRAYLVPNVPTNGSDNITTKLTELAGTPDISQIQDVQNYELQKNGTSTLSYNSQTDSYLILNESYYPGWTAHISNMLNSNLPTNLIPAQNINGLKVFSVPKGQHSVTVSYEPKSFKAGLYISFASLIILIVLFIYPRKKLES